ncbi:hypothetical protein PHLGIDRAFT_400918 [Phlebiopsis gigantea 11061_1 CR5-6]|uniref:DUF6533 domain-containing protein n=1 Tax=Phlebiopsis gigantea (strain 11061_1 CR5-6) TaxID=745531 RepID=A0A0C3SBH2_PHLG1|nr:hypothetical protein PHLGIDRAFT_400918 [Phlebiopsis gigantea 11061_1 CR5-6]
MSTRVLDASIAAAITTQSYIITATWALAIYEYLITFQEEVKAIKKRRFHLGILFLIATRYVMLLSPLPQVLTTYSQLSPLHRGVHNY